MIPVILIQPLNADIALHYAIDESEKFCLSTTV
jgi:hypothetical protein